MQTRTDIPLIIDTSNLRSRQCVRIVALYPILFRSFFSTMDSANNKNTRDDITNRQLTISTQDQTCTFSRKIENAAANKARRTIDARTRTKSGREIHGRKGLYRVHVQLPAARGRKIEHACVR